MQDFIELIGANEHNLKDISLKIPRNKLVVITGISGSGKSSLAFDTIYAEGQRRYIETFSAYARQFMGELKRPQVEKITGLSPVISIEQKTVGKNPRSTVGTVTELYDFMRLLYARIGEAHSYVTGKKMEQYTEDAIIDLLFEKHNGKRMTLLAPKVRARKGHYRELFEQLRKQGYTKVRVDTEVIELVPQLQVDRYKTHDIELIVDRVFIESDKRARIVSSVQTALKQGGDFILLEDADTKETFGYSKKLMCQDSGISYEVPSPNAFSFNSPYGACPKCNGLGELHQVDENLVLPDKNLSINEQGIAPLGEVRDNQLFKHVRQIAKHFMFSFTTPVKDIPHEALQCILYGNNKELAAKLYDKKDYAAHLAEEGLIPMLQRWHQQTASEGIRQFAEGFMSVSECPECQGKRLKKESLWFLLAGKNIAEISELTITDLYAWISTLSSYLSERQLAISTEIIKEITLRTGFLLEVGLDYLSLNRAAKTLSGGESQRIRLATQIGSKLTGITYILDEPSIGLHQRDNARLINALKALASIDNSVLVVEHDKDIMMASDYLIDLGPGAGKNGGSIVSEGTPEEVLKQESPTALYLNNQLSVKIPAKRRKGNGKFLRLLGACGNNLKSVNLHLPLGSFICVTGVSGSGKSTLINDTLYPILRKHFYNSLQQALAYDSIEGIENLDKVIEVDQSPIGRTPRSNPATYTGLFTEIRKLYAEIPEAKIRGYKVGRFSFNVKGGRCESCEGAGKRVIEMNFLPDVEVDCETCLGKRYNRETLEILYKGKSISEVLDMSVEDAVDFFKAIPKIHRKLKILNDVGLGYISLGQSAITLSGGEAQRIKLAEELSKKDTGNTLYILDEPTTGLHFQDINLLLDVLQKLVDKGNTMLVIEHNLDVIKTADYVIDIGKEGGKNGGTILVEGTPESVAAFPGSYTGFFLQKELKATTLPKKY